MDKQLAAGVAAAAGNLLLAAPASDERSRLDDALTAAFGLGFVGPEDHAAALRLLGAGGRVDVAAALVPDRSLGWRWLVRDDAGGGGFANVTHNYGRSSWTAGDATVHEEEGIAERAEAATPALALAAAAMLARAAFLRGEGGPRRSTQWHDGSESEAEAPHEAPEASKLTEEARQRLERLVSEVRLGQRRRMERMATEDAGGA